MSRAFMRMDGMPVGVPAFVLRALLAALVGAAPALADVLHLKGGGTLEGQILGVQDEEYQIRTIVGRVSLPVSVVERVEPGPTPFEEYDQRKAQAHDTAEDQTALATWCGEQGLKSEERAHLRRAIELNPNYAPARQALGYVRVGTLWVDGRRVVQRAAPEEATADPQEQDPQKLAQAIQSQWFQRLQAVRRSLLESSQERLVAQGRQTILEIHDPLAILPLSQVLARGTVATRQLLVQALAAFPQDEATMNLAVLALIDPSESVREPCVSELVRRHDPRVIAQYREALRSDSDAIIRRAAYALGRLDARVAIPDLIDVLTARRNRWVEVPARNCVSGMRKVFTTPTEVYLGADGRTHLLAAPQIGVGNFIYNIDNEMQYREVTVFRTEVQEALKEITGQNFGFEHDQWRRWYRESLK